MTVIASRKLAREIAHLAHGKALFALAPVLIGLPEEKRERVLRYLASEYAEFDEPVARLLMYARTASRRVA